MIMNDVRASARQLDVIADQLDLIADTALANDGTHSSSVMARPSAGTHSSSLRAGSDTGTHSSSVDRLALMKKVDATRRQSGISIAKLCAAAKVHPNTYRELRRGACTPLEITLDKFTRALDRIRTGKAQEVAPPQVVAGFHRLLMQLIATQMGFDHELLLATDFSVQRPSNPQWLRAARIRQMAIYVVAVELQVSNADLGRALGDTRANIKFARDAIEDRREDGNEIDSALTAVSLHVRSLLV